MSEEFMGAIETFKEAIIKAWEKLKAIIAKVVKLYQVAIEHERMTKIRYDPVRKIRPRKLRLPDKRTNIYYCRNNC